MANNVEQAISQAVTVSESIPKELRSAGFGVLLAHFLGGTQSPAPLAAVQHSSSDGIPATLPEFIAIKKPKTHPQHVTCFAYFSYRSGDSTGLTIKDLEQCYQDIRKKKPQNLSDVIGSCVGQRRGWLTQVPGDKSGSKAWIVTRVGEEAIENNFKTP